MTTTTPATKKAADKTKGKAPKKATVKKAAAAKAPAAPLTTDRMNDDLLAIHGLAKQIDDLRAQLDTLVAQSDAKVQEAVDNGERYRDVAAAAGRTVPWVQMSLRRFAGVATHPAAPIPTTRIRRPRTSRRAS
jgi:hypothetical protein